MNNKEAYIEVRNQDALEYCKKQSMLEQMVGNETWKHYEHAAMALKKQIPKKPAGDPSYYLNALHCPACGYFLGYPHNKHQKFCAECGQAIDWSV